MVTTSLINPLVVVVGETASGKSALALELAKRFDGEIICADSWTVRRQVNIGTAKPTAEEQAQIPHHLLDIVEPCENFTAAVFKDMAAQAIADISSRGKLPIMVGGTGLYIDGVIFDFGFLDEAEPDVRAELEGLNIEQLLARIKRRKLSLEGIDIRNKRRLMRLLETSGARPTRKDMRAHTLILGLSLPREVLKQRIATRLEGQIQNGLEQEVKHLADAYGWQCEALKGIGYQEWQAYFAGKYDLSETKARIIRSTLALAKRQRTWFKRNKSIQWVQKQSEAVDIVTTVLNKNGL